MHWLTDTAGIFSLRRCKTEQLHLLAHSTITMRDWLELIIDFAGPLGRRRDC